MSDANPHPSRDPEAETRSETNRPAAAPRIESEPDLIRLLTEQNRLLSDQLKFSKSVRARFGMGLVTGFGTVLGATVMVSLVVLALKPLANVRWISPIVNQVIEELESRPVRTIPKVDFDKDERSEEAPKPPSPSE